MRGGRCGAWWCFGAVVARGRSGPPWQAHGHGFAVQPHADQFRCAWHTAAPYMTVLEHRRHWSPSGPTGRLTGHRGRRRTGRPSRWRSSLISRGLGARDRTGRTARAVASALATGAAGGSSPRRPSPTTLERTRAPRDRAPPPTPTGQGRCWPGSLSLERASTDEATPQSTFSHSPPCSRVTAEPHHKAPPHFSIVGYFLLTAGDPRRSPSRGEG